VLTAVSKGMQAEKLCSNKILQLLTGGAQLMQVVLFNCCKKMLCVCCDVVWCMFTAQNQGKAKSNAAEEKSLRPPRANWFVMGCGFGSLLYVTQAVFGEVSLVLRWVVSGYPNPGPTPYPWG